MAFDTEGGGGGLYFIIVVVTSWFVKDDTPLIRYQV